MVNAAAQSKEALEAAGNLGFDLFRRHAVVKSGDHHLGNIDGGEQIDRHPGHAGDAHDGNQQASHDHYIRISDGKTSHDLCYSGGLLLLICGRFRARAIVRCVAGITNSEAAVQNMTPPIIASARGMNGSLPVPILKAMGSKPTSVANEVIATGRKRTRQPVTIARSGSMPVSIILAGYSTTRMLVD